MINILKIKIVINLNDYRVLKDFYYSTLCIYKIFLLHLNKFLTIIFRNKLL